CPTVTVPGPVPVATRVPASDVLVAVAVPVGAVDVPELVLASPAGIDGVGDGAGPPPPPPPPPLGGGATGVPDTACDGRESPTMLVATTVTSYAVPLVKPLIVAGEPVAPTLTGLPCAGVATIV